MFGSGDKPKNGLVMEWGSDAAVRLRKSGGALEEEEITPPTTTNNQQGVVVTRKWSRAPFSANALVAAVNNRF